MNRLLEVLDPGTAGWHDHKLHPPGPLAAAANVQAVPATGLPGLDFDLPPSLEATEPPEARGLRRDEVRLMVSHYRDDGVLHAAFRDLPHFLEAGDALIINTSGTLNAALAVHRDDGTALEL